jgi:hypothetical protein
MQDPQSAQVAHDPKADGKKSRASRTSSRRRFLRTGAAVAGGAAAAIYTKPDIRSFGIPEVLAASGAVATPAPDPSVPVPSSPTTGRRLRLTR